MNYPGGKRKRIFREWQRYILRRPYKVYISRKAVNEI